MQFEITVIQNKAEPHILGRRNLVGAMQTGLDKMLASFISAVELIKSEHESSYIDIQMLVKLCSACSKISQNL